MSAVVKLLLHNSADKCDPCFTCPSHTRQPLYTIRILLLHNAADAA